jgi:hypothetical protein
MKENKLMVTAAYNAVMKYLDYLIMATPTGKARELLSEANIQLMRARQAWEDTDGKPDTEEKGRQGGVVAQKRR